MKTFRGVCAAVVFMPLAAILDAALFIEPAAAVYPWEAKCDNASRACQHSKYRRQCMCRHGCEAYCNSDDEKRSEAVEPLIVPVQVSCMWKCQRGGWSRQYCAEVVCR